MIISLGKERADLLDQVDSINDCRNKLSFIAEFLASGRPGFNFEIGERTTSGIHCILQEINEELSVVADELSHKIKKDPEAAKKGAAAELKDLDKE
jgi:hypothetical protein